jgi:hypothetical protein
MAMLAACGPVDGARAATAVLEFTPMVGWQWGGTLDYGNAGSVHSNAALNYGGALGAQLRPGEWAEISYTYQSTDVTARPPATKEFKLFDLTTQYIQASGGRILVQGADANQLRAYPYVIGGLGMTILSPGRATVDSVNTGTEYLFSVSVGGGVRVKLNEKIDLRLQSRLLLPMNFESGGFYFGSGGGAVTVSGGSVMPQGEATLGITFKQAGSATVTK